LFALAMVSPFNAAIPRRIDCGVHHSGIARTRLDTHPTAEVLHVPPGRIGPSETQTVGNRSRFIVAHRPGKRKSENEADLGGAASALCLAQTGANPVRPHMLTMNKASTHAIVSFVASGHVLFMDAQTRQPISCIRTSVGSTGVRQVHQSFPSPDETYVAVANQNGKLYERINTDYNTNTFVLDHSVCALLPGGDRRSSGCVTRAGVHPPALIVLFNARSSPRRCEFLRNSRRDGYGPRIPVSDHRDDP
jgi:hypothetical protein